MKTQKIIQDYYGDLYYLDRQKNKQICIFIVDDNEIYRNLLKEKLAENPNFWIHCYSTGEECLRYLELKPDLVILDYHLDAVHPQAQKGDAIYWQIKARFPETKIIMISSDKKLNFLSDLNKHETTRVMRKDGFTFDNLRLRLYDLSNKHEKNTLGTFFKVAVFIIFPVFSIIRLITNRFM